MKHFLFIFLILITAGSLVAQTPTVANLTTSSGSNIKWYSAAIGGTLYTGTEALVNGQHYFASQTVNGIESITRLDVTATVTLIPAAPVAGTHVATQTQIDWKWAAVTGATGYKWSATNNYSSATDLGNVLTKSESSLTCGTSYTRYVWAYNTTACGSTAASFTQSTTSCISAPTLTTSAGSSIGSTTATFNGNITSINGATVTVRGFKYSTTNGFNPASTGTNVSESGSFSTGAFTSNLTGLTSSTTYYVCAFATNSAGTSYGSQVSFTTNPQTDFNYTGGMQSFTVPATGTYKLEVWGAQGGAASSNAGGLGGYSSGNKSLTAGDVIYILVGQIGQAPGGGAAFNGGGAGICCGAGGGGGTDIRIGGQALSNRVIVAGGGGGGSSDVPIGPGGAGGGTSGGSGTSGGCTAAGGTQSSGYALGDGQSNTGDAAGGGGGYYGGYAGCDTSGGSGGGGSGYIGGVTSGSTTSGLRSGDGFARIALYIP